MKIPETLNADFIEAQYRAWKSEPGSVTRDWRFFFEGFEMADGHPRFDTQVCDEDQMLRQSRVDALLRRYRDIGHLLACLDPLAACPTDHPLLNPAAFDLTPEDLQTRFYAGGLFDGQKASLADIIGALKETYCHAVGVEYMHIQDPAERQWLQQRIEPGRNRPDLSRQDRLRILECLTQSTLFEQFLNKKYVGVTRFSLEGADALIALLDSLVRHICRQGCREMILGMAHRGRLNVQTHILGKSYEDIFGEFENCYDAGDLVGNGDVKYHNGYLADLTPVDGMPLRIFLVNNPSHLEAVNPVVEGVSRARQDLLGLEGADKVLPVLLHGDAAFAGQGIVAEVLNMSQLDGYKTGGTLHIIVNNQIGYTTLPDDARSTRYSTDVAKMLMVPIFHVHGEDPEAVVHVTRLALDYRAAFHKDVVIDVIGYRRYGHNEGDEPYFTQPRMYERIRQRKPLNKIYAGQLLDQGDVDQGEIDQMAAPVRQALEDAYEEIHGSACPFPQASFYENWGAYHGKYSPDPVDTAVAAETLLELSTGLNRVPPDFTLHSTLKRMLKRRLDAVEKGQGIDWANAEALALATLLTEGVPVRLSGQDCARGTFSQRHSVWFDTQAGEAYVPLNSLGGGQAPFSVHNSLLAEASVLGFEYGYAMVRPEALVMWEAQFGDFINNAQAVIDLFIVSGESKWQRLNGLVLLLPHGLEGLGPEHSSARPERFLQLCADDNIQVCYPTTPAQYFHLLRLQIKGEFRKPLVILTPKSLLRHPMAVSALKDLDSGSFKKVIDDTKGLENATRLLICSGKIYYELAQRRRDSGTDNTAIVRLEQYYPFPRRQLEDVLKRYRKTKKIAWVQEEPRNMGAWGELRPYLKSIIGKSPDYIGRPPSTSPASGFPVVYKMRQQTIIDTAVGPLKS